MKFTIFGGCGGFKIEESQDVLGYTSAPSVMAVSAETAEAAAGISGVVGLALLGVAGLGAGVRRGARYSPGPRKIPRDL